MPLEQSGGGQSRFERRCFRTQAIHRQQDELWHSMTFAADTVSQQGRWYARKVVPPARVSRPYAPTAERVAPSGGQQKAATDRAARVSPLRSRFQHAAQQLNILRKAA